MVHDAVDALAHTLMLGALLEQLAARHGGYKLLEHWTQGEFHHDLVLRVYERRGLPASVLVVSTNCNGGIKEVACYERVPSRWALWHARCPDNPEFEGELPRLLGRARTLHWFDPCELLSDSARSLLKPHCRRRQRGGGYEPAPST